MSHLPPTVAKIIDIDGEYFDERELLLAAYADGLPEAECRLLVSELNNERDEDRAAEQQAEIAAENAWLRAAENAGWEDTLRERDIYGI